MSEKNLTAKENVKNIFDGCMTVPNLLSVIRILLIPVFAVLYMKGYIWWAVLVLAVSGLSDFFDGKIARKFNQVSALGKMLDPIADKLTIFALAIVLYLKFKSADSPSMKAFAWVFLLFIVKDIIMLLGGLAIISRGARPAPAAIYGKVSTFAFYVIMLLIIAFGPEVGAISQLNPSLTLPEIVVYILVIIALILTFVAFASYIPDAARQILNKDKKTESDGSEPLEENSEE
ncbi:MAG: CDP-alcohol phosphatidyltransferase family protein [Ruminococcaceae bacterium]|nr:CDP-alcohol phosphatidyltransferase family protein [Oscillospiraceae bacterium]